MHKKIQIGLTVGVWGGGAKSECKIFILQNELKIYFKSISNQIFT